MLGVYCYELRQIREAHPAGMLRRSEMTLGASTRNIRLSRRHHTTPSFHLTSQDREVIIWLRYMKRDSKSWGQHEATAVPYRVGRNECGAARNGAIEERAHYRHSLLGNRN